MCISSARKTPSGSAINHLCYAHLKLYPMQHRTHPDHIFEENAGYQLFAASCFSTSSVGQCQIVLLSSSKVETGSLGE
ncbi:hypothetical protein KCU85_g50, partial [Aureobasidium melanogenum]